ncbi:hypothetical protein SETIT_8G210300v2 [Setaria italica]|uniref:Laccase n=2 Tax=Setaria italica TaxID=4555 RepID=A0A368SA02_SETIT|nr:laccase-15 [Setaria italica]RCV39275.1 hypothetical protein SETIT_8G210300v2 [Setaria italica]
MQTMERRSFPALVAATVILFLSATAQPAAGAIVEHTFIVGQMNMTHLCKEMLVTVVNGQLPGPVIEVTEGDTVVVHVVNKSPYNITIHWHGVKQQLNCWADGVPMITQCPIGPNNNFTYTFNVTGQEGTLWWHAHVAYLRGTLHGAIIIRPRHGVSSYPFPEPHREIPIVLGEWWQMDLQKASMDIKYSTADDDPSAATINGKLGDLYNCSGVKEDGFVLDVEAGKTYLLRIINAALFYEYYIRIAGHKFTVVAADANYVSPLTTDLLAVAPGQTLDALVVANAAPGRYYMVASPNQPPKPDFQHPTFTTRGIVQYTNENHSNGGSSGPGAEGPLSRNLSVVAPEMPDEHDTMTSYYFHGKLTALHPSRSLPVPARVDEHLLIALGLGSVCKRGQSCNRGESEETFTLATMNNISFELPAATAAGPLLEAHYYNTGSLDMLRELPDRPPRMYNFTDPSLIPSGPREASLEATSKATIVRRFRHGTVVEVVFQSTAMWQSDSNPMHLHGHDMFVLAQGLGNYNAATDVAKYNLVDPPVRNTVLVPRLGWVAVRFVANNPGAWFVHCHFSFHLSMGMAAVFVVEDGPTVNTSLPPPPADFLTCYRKNNPVADEFDIRSTKSEIPDVTGA